MSSWRSRSQPLTWSILSCRSDCSARSLSKSASGSPIALQTSSKRSRRSFVLATPSVTLPSTSLFGSSRGSCGRKPTEKPGRDPAFALVAVVLAGDDAQQRRLAGAVQAEHPDLGAGVHRDVDAAQHLLVGRVHPAQIAHRQNELVSHTPHRTGHSEEEHVSEVFDIADRYCDAARRARPVQRDVRGHPRPRPRDDRLLPRRRAPGGSISSRDTLAALGRRAQGRPTTTGSRRA